MYYLGIDYGQKRIGLSYGDELGIATPLPPLVRPVDIWSAFQRIIREKKIEAFVVGYPIGMNDKPTQWTHEVEAFGEELHKRFSLPVYWSDERLTSYQVEQDLADAQLRPKAKFRISHRRTGVDDSRAATLILQDFLNEQLSLPEPFTEENDVE